jgi:ABC-2 type transport system ATP-binding protein
VNVAIAVEIRNLSKRFGSFVAVDDVSFAVEEGEIFGFLGANGAGKSTTIRMLCGLLRPSAGFAHVLGIDVGRDPEGVKQRIGYMSQRFSLYEDLTVIQNLRFFGGIYGLSGALARERERWALEMAALAGEEDRLARELAGGWRQRLALACAVLHQPRVLFLDEPTSGVDPISRRQFWRLIDSMAADGVTVFVTTHYLDEAEYCHRLALIHAGRLVSLGSVSQMKSIFGAGAVLEVVAPRATEALESLSQAPWVIETSIFGRRLHAVVRAGQDAQQRTLELLEAQGNVPAHVVSIVPSIEDVFIHHVELEEQRLRESQA